MVSHRGVGVLYQPERSAACLLSPAIEVIHGTIILQLIVQENIAACCTSSSSTTTPPPPHSVTAESYLWKADTDQETLSTHGVMYMCAVKHKCIAEQRFVFHTMMTCFHPEKLFSLKY